MYEYQILQELQRSNSFLNTVTINQSNIHNEILEIQEQLDSGDRLLREELSKSNTYNGILVVFVCIMLFWLVCFGCIRK